jgi:hypothetical protein
MASAFPAENTRLLNPLEQSKRGRDSWVGVGGCTETGASAKSKG